MRMVALTQTLTSSLHLQDVVVEDPWVLRPPSANALAGRRNGLTLGQTFVATGLCRAALDLIAEHDVGRRPVGPRPVRRPVGGRAGRGPRPVPARPRGRRRGRQRPPAGACNDLALRVTHAAVALYKGTALLADHPAQRLAREAMFLLVWSCPNPVIDCTVDLLTRP